MSNVNEKRLVELRRLRQAGVQAPNEQGPSRLAGEVDLYTQIQRIASENPETRVHLVPLLRKFADGFGDEVLGGRTWGNPDPHSTPDDSVPYKHHENSPPAGADGSPQRKKYNEWYRRNVCPKHKTNCGAPWLRKASNNWTEIVGEKTRIRWRGHPQPYALIEELPQKGKQKLTRYDFDISGQVGHNASHHLMMENLVRDWNPHSGMTPDQAASGLRDALKEAFKKWDLDIKDPKGRNVPPMQDWLRDRLLSRTMFPPKEVFYQEVEPRDYVPIVVRSSGQFILTANWNSFEISLNNSRSDAKMDGDAQDHDPHYIRLVQKSKGGARSFFKWCKANQASLNTMTAEALKEALKDNKIAYEYSFSVWR